jgi:hypothetical protein
MNEELELLYNDYAKDKGFSDFNEFQTLMEDDSARKVFFDESNKDLGFKDYDEFNALIGKKKSSGFPTGNPFTKFLSEPDPKSLGPVRAEDAPVSKKETAVPHPRQAPSAWDANIKYKIKEDKKKDDYKKSLSDYYDNAEAQFGPEQLATNPALTFSLYKDFLEKKGEGDRLKYLQQKELSERVDKEEQSAPRPLISNGRLNPNGLSPEEQTVSPTETGLKIQEEALNFRYSMLKEKKEQILKSPDNQKKLATLEQLKTKIDEKPDDQQLIDQYNTILQDPDISKLNNIFAQDDLLSGEAKKLLTTHKEVFSERFDKMAKQQAIDDQFASNSMEDPRAGVVKQLGRSATGLISDLLKIPSLFDGDNEYSAVDKWSDLVDKTVDHIDTNLFPIPSDYNAPMFSNDSSGNSTWRTDLIVPKTAKVVGDMAALFYGAGRVSNAVKAVGVGQKAAAGIGLFTSSYGQSFNDYKKEAMEAGMSPEEAHWFAHTSAAGQSALELISPQKYLWAAAPKNVAESFMKNISAGMNRGAALKAAGAFTTKQIAGENLQEVTQNISDAAVRHYTNQILDKEVFSNDDFFNQSLETLVLTSIVGGAPAAVAAGAKVAGNNSLYDESVRLIAEDKKKYMPMLQQAISDQNISPEQTTKILNDINAVPVPDAGQPLYIIDGEVSSKEAVLKRVEEGKPQGIAVYNDPETGKALGVKPRVKVKGDLMSTESEQAEKVNTEIPAEELQVLSTPEDITKFESEQTTDEGRRLGAVMQSAKKVLSKIVPDLKIGLYKGDAVAGKILGDRVSQPFLANGFYDHTNGTMYLNTEFLTPDVAFHEAVHPIIRTLKQVAPEKFEKFAAQAGEIKVETAEGIVDYMSRNDSNAEEAITEFLGDVSSNKFDESPTIIERAKKLVGQFLEAVGLKPADIGLDLDSIDDLKSFAGTIAKAFKEGKAVSFKKRGEPKTDPLIDAIENSGGPSISAENEVDASRRKAEKLNQTAKRIAADENSIYKQIQKEVISNPQRFSYTPQDVKNKKLDLANMTDQELVAETESIDKLISNISQNNNFAVLSAIEAINRAVAQGKDSRPIFDKMRQLGTSVGQLLRQFGELKSGTPAGVFNIVSKHLEAQNKQLTEGQAKELQKLADEFIKSKVESDKAHKEFTDNPSKATENALNKTLNNKDDKFNDLNKFVGLVTPMGVDSMIGTVLQGNLLTLKSVIANVVGNALFTPLRQVELMAGDIGAYITQRMKGRNPLNPVEMWFGAAFNGIKGFGESLPKTAKNAVSGNTSASNQTLEIRRGLKPLTAWWQVLTKEGRGTLPVNSKGNIPLSLYLEKSLEATSGIPAELMFRMLYLGDAPFKEGAKKASAYRMFAEAGGGSSAEFRKFLLNLDDNQKEALDKRALEATFGDERTLATVADMTLSGIKKAIDVATEWIPSKPFRDFINTTVHVAQKANVPFVRVPSNLIQYMIELTMPVIPMMAGLRYIKSDARKASQLFARAGTGFAFLYMADMLIEGGAVIAGGEGDDEAKKQLKYVTAAPNTINISAARRVVLGIQDPDAPFKEGDKFVDFSKLGPMGIALVARAQFREKVKSEGEDYKEMAFGTKQMEILNAGLRSSLELSFLQGTANLMEAVKDDGIQSYASELANTMSAIAIPNSVSAFTRGRRETMLRAKDKDILNAFVEKQSIKLFPALEDNVAGVYPVISMWGKPVIQNKDKGAFGDINPFVKQFFDITNGGVIDDATTIEIYNLSERTGEVPITAPSQKVTVYDADDNEVSVTLLEEDYTQLQMLAGQLKKMAVTDLMMEEDWKTWDDAEKAEALKDENEYANSAARDYILGRIEQDIEDGRIVLDSEGKTYSYLAPKPFDYNAIKAHLEEEQE